MRKTTSGFTPHFQFLPNGAISRPELCLAASSSNWRSAEVLISKPSLILLDEPSEGIQPSIVQDIARTVVDLNRRTNVAIIFVEQNLDMIRAMAQRCYVMDKGKIVAALTPADLDNREVVRRHLAV